MLYNRIQLEAASSPKARMTHRYSTEQIIPIGGIYFVYHQQHRLIRSVRLYAGDRFPRCSECHDQVEFELMMEMPEHPGEQHIHLYQLDLREEAEEEQARNESRPE
jgi:hypothetical protein